MGGLWQKLGVFRKSQDPRVLGSSAFPSFPGVPQPLSPPVPKAQGILQRKELISCFQLSSFCLNYLLNSDASSVAFCHT